MFNKKGGVAYLDGIRGVAAFLVFVHHFLLAFYSAYYNSDMAATHLNGLEVRYGQSLFSVFSNGNFCVEIFFVLSGMVLSRKYFMTDDIEIPISGCHRRFIRLYVPVAFTLLLAYIMIKAGLFLNKPVSAIAHSEWWFAGQWDIPDTFHRLLTCLGYSTMFQSDSVFDTSMWTLSWELYGSMLVFAFLTITHFVRFRGLMLFLLVAYFYYMNNVIYLAFALGMSLCYTERWVAQNGKKYFTVISLVLIGLGLIGGSYPSTDVRQGTFFEHLGHTLLEYSGWFHAVGAYFLVLAFVISPFLQRLASARTLRFIGYISFSLYLLHPLIDGSFSSWLFLRLFHANVGYNTCVLIVFLATIPVLLFTSWLMTKYVDEGGIRLSKHFYKFIRRKVTFPVS